MTANHNIPISPFLLMPFCGASAQVRLAHTWTWREPHGDTASKWPKEWERVTSDSKQCMSVDNELYFIEEETHFMS